MNNLLIDIGNSVIKTAEGSRSNNLITKIRKKPYLKRDFKKEFSEFLISINFKTEFNLIGVSSLNKSNNLFLRKSIKKHFGKESIFINNKIHLPIKIEYTSSIGNDRICNAVAADNLFPGKNILVIDFGTATTYTLVSEKILKGGIISPGILTAFNSLKDKTSLKFSNISFPEKLIGQTTEDNIKSGIMNQTLIFCEYVINEIRKSHRGLKVIITGGFSEFMSNRSKLFDLTDRELVFKGVNLIIKYNENINKRINN
ncbi:MAG TPA: type III pantothenate kinase [Ignavibacteria bacterium]|nr:type III pantothenate kinase [Ignavibacteria bacterium]